MRYVRFRFALTGRRSGGTRTPDTLSVRGGPLRTAKCASERVYGDSVWFELLSVDSWCNVLFSVGRRMILGSASNGSRWVAVEDETERRRRESGLWRESWLWAEWGGSVVGGVSTEWARPLLVDRENWDSMLSGVMGRRVTDIRDAPPSERVVDREISEGGWIMDWEW